MMTDRVLYNVASVDLFEHIRALYHYFLLLLSSSLTKTQTSGNGRGSPRRRHRCRRSTLSVRRNEILSTSYRSSPSQFLLSPVPRLCRCRCLHLPVLLYLMYPLSRISPVTIIRRPSPPLNLSATLILSCISAASVVIIPHIRCGIHCIVSHHPTPFNAVICIHVSCVSLPHSSLYISISSPGLEVGGEPPPSPSYLFYSSES